jgi:hypothetical protein
MTVPINAVLQNIERTNFHILLLKTLSVLMHKHTHNERIHSDKIKLRRLALQLYFSGDAVR